jgi:mannitol 2-dehydrogenase
VIKICRASIPALENICGVPSYDPGKIVPGIVHIGVGSFHRSHQAYILDKYIAETKDFGWGVLGAGVLPGDVALRDALKSQDFLYTLMEKEESGAAVERVQIIGSLVDMMVVPEDTSTFISRIADCQVRIVTLTITEGGYKIDHATGKFRSDDPDIQYDILNQNTPRTVFGLITAALKLRRERGEKPFTVLSCDNLQSNGDICRESMLAFCRLIDTELASWVQENGAFPNSMVDRITPATTDDDRKHLRTQYGIDDNWPVVSEPFFQWVVEDNFSQGRPALEKVGVQFTRDVAPYEKMKLRLLNASHSALGYLGYLCGYDHIHDIARNHRFQQMLHQYMYKEAIPTLDPVPGIDLEQYCESLVKRFSNSAIKDKTLRICRDGSAKIPRFLLPVVSDLKNKNQPFNVAALVVASWWRFLKGVDYTGREIPIDDPERELLVERAGNGIRDFLQTRSIFGDLGTWAPFASKVEQYGEMFVLHSASEVLEAFLEGEK